MSKKKSRDVAPPNMYRGKDVTGALALVSSMMDWDLLPKEERPTTDREAARLFFKQDHGNATMADFLQHVKHYNERELQQLRKASRIPPKRLVGFINAATGEKRPAFPDFLTLPADAYDELLCLIRWSDACPAGIELGDHVWERIHDQIAHLVPLDEAQWPGVFVDSAQIESVETSQRNITPGTLVVLLSHEDDAESTEHHCVLLRAATADDSNDADTAPCDQLTPDVDRAKK